MAEGKIPANPLFLRDDDLRQGIELLFFAYRDFTAKADEILLQYGFGRAHHRVIYFVGRNPGMTVSSSPRSSGLWWPAPIAAPGPRRWKASARYCWA
jgi:hypothetical protein